MRTPKFFPVELPRLVVMRLALAPGFHASKMVCRQKDLSRLQSRGRESPALPECRRLSRISHDPGVHEARSAIQDPAVWLLCDAQPLASHYLPRDHPCAVAVYATSDPPTCRELPC